MKNVVVITGAGQMGKAIARRIGSGKKVLLADYNPEMAGEACRIMLEAGFDAEAVTADITDREAVLGLIGKAQEYGPIKYLVNTAGRTQGDGEIEDILNTNVYGVAMLLEEFGKVIAPGGAGLVISSEAAHELAALTEEQDLALGLASAAELRNLDFLKNECFPTKFDSYKMSKHCIEQRVVAEAVKWGDRGARLNAIAPAKIITPNIYGQWTGEQKDALDDLFAKMPARRPGTPDEIAGAAEFLLGDRAGYITGTTLLMDGGARASHYFGPLSRKESKKTEEITRKEKD